jgi:hypothetical protein
MEQKQNTERKQVVLFLFFVNDNLYFEPGLFTTTKSTEFETSSSTASLEAYVEGLRIPISAGYILIGDIDTFANLRVFAGPSGYFVTSVGRDVNKADSKDLIGVFFLVPALMFGDSLLKCRTSGH